MKKQALLLGLAICLMGAKNSDVLPIAQPMTAKDKQLGSTEHPKILEEFGGAYSGRQADYVRSIGQKIAVQSGLSNSQSDFTVTTINSPVNNAFAIPGGYVYVTRQLMALMNNEAELASVLGHEVGHVAARHSASRQKRATTGGLLATGATILGAVLGGGQGAQLGQQIGGSLATRWVLKFSRSQEYQSDDLGISYLAKAGYDPMAASTMLASLAAQTSLEARVQGQAERNLPEWASTHPDPASRVTRAAQKAGVSNPVGKAQNRDAFLAALDGIMYDDDPKQGVVDGQNFKHPDLKLAFTAPQGFSMQNGSSAVTIGSSSGVSQFSSGPYSGDLRAYVDNLFKAISQANNNVQLNYGQAERLTINGLNAARASADVQGQQGTITVTVYAYEFANNQAFHFFTKTASGNAAVFNSMYQSVRRISDSEAAAIKPRRIDVVTVKSGDTIEKLASRMAYDTFKVERFTVLNALKPGAALSSGQKVKIVTY